MVAYGGPGGDDGPGSSKLPGAGKWHWLGAMIAIRPQFGGSDSIPREAESGTSFMGSTSAGLQAPPGSDAWPLPINALSALIYRLTWRPFQREKGRA